MPGSGHTGNKKKEDDAIASLLTQLESADMIERETACRMLANCINGESSGEGQAPVDGKHLIETYGERIAPLLLTCLRVGISSDDKKEQKKDKKNRESEEMMLEDGEEDDEDSPEEVKTRLMISACEAIRALCGTGGVLICEQLTKNCSAVSTLLGVVRECCAVNASKPTPTSAEDQEDEDDDDVSSLLIQVVLLLTELSENSEKALAQLTETGFLQSLCGLLLRCTAPELAATPLSRFWATASRDVRLLSARLVQVSTEGNATLAKLLIGLGGGDFGGFVRACKAATDALAADSEMCSVLFAICANVCQAGGCADGIYIREYADFLKTLLSIDCGKELLEQVEPALNASNYENEMEDADLAVSSPPDCIAEWKKRVVAQQLVLETIANACCSAATVIEEEGDDDDDDDEMDSSTTAEESVEGDTFTPEVGVLRENGILDIIALRAGSGLAPALRFASNHGWASHHAAELVLAQARGVSCLTNVLINGLIGDAVAQWRSGVSVMNASLDAYARLSSSSSDLHTRVNSGTTMDDSIVELLEEATSLLHAVAEHIGADGASSNRVYQSATEDLLSVVDSGASNTASIHAIFAIAVVARPLWTTLPIADSIATTLISVAIDESSDVELVSAACNAVMDLFAEQVTSKEVSDASVRSQLHAMHARITDAFTQLLPAFRRRIAAERANRDRALLNELRETRINLSRFLRYKSKQKH